ncbi:DUF72 domain-containing protein [Rhodoflexus sp.]
MDFGKLDDISGVDFSLPPDRTRWEALPKPRSNSVQVYIGCPVWACKEWTGILYPTTAREKDYLRHYSRQFNTIELNATHYRIPDEATIQRWVSESPATFRFCPKIPQEISHRLMLQNAEELTGFFCEQVAALGERLGICFLQLPPYFAPEHLPILEQYLQKFPAQVPLAIEFRHPDWFRGTPDVQPFAQAAALLQDLQVSTVICDVSGRRDVLHQQLTTRTAVVRFVGNGLHPTDYTRIDEWVGRLQVWMDRGLDEVYFFVHEPDNVLAPQLADYLIAQLNQRFGLTLKRPQFVPKTEQMNLF